MEDTVTEELKLGVLMKDNVHGELDLLHQMSTSLLVFDMKRKQLDSHFDSLVSLIERQRDEAMKAIRLMEDEAEVAAEKRRKELRLREERLGVKIENDKKEVERRAAECVVKEKEMREAKMAAERMSVELCGKKKEVNVMKKAVDDLTAQVQAENARFNDTCQRLSDENLALRNEVKLLTQQLELKAQPLGREEQISEPLNKKCFELPATPRSKGVPKDTLSANPESGSKDCCSNSSSNAEPVKNQTSELPETVATIDMSATEIEYPTLNVIDNADEEEDHQNGPHSLFDTKRLKVEEDCNEEDSDVVLVNTNDGDVGRKRRNKAQSPFYASARKKSKQSSSRNMQVENIYGNRRPIDQSGAQKVETDQTTIKRGYCGKEPILDSEGRIQCVIQGRYQTGSQTEKAVERARAFRAEEPVCIIAQQPTYVCPQKKCHLPFPASFIVAYVNLKIKDVMLRTNDGRTWTLKYYLTESQHVCYLTSGWKKFAIDNDLKAGDVCLFELIKGAENALKVVVFRVTDEDEAPI